MGDLDASHILFNQEGDMQVKLSLLIKEKF